MKKFILLEKFIRMEAYFTDDGLAINQSDFVEYVQWLVDKNTEREEGWS